MLNFIICDDEPHMLNKLSLLFEKSFIKNDFDAKIVLKTSKYKDNPVTDYLRNYFYGS